MRGTVLVLGERVTHARTHAPISLRSLTSTRGSGAQPSTAISSHAAAPPQIVAGVVGTVRLGSSPGSGNSGVRNCK
jgi:hypothetical protein